MGNPAVARPAEVADAEAIARVHAAAWKAGYQGMMPAEFLAQVGRDGVERWTRILTAELTQPALPAAPTRGSRTFVVDDSNGELVGISSIGVARGEGDPALGELWMLNLAPEAWGTGLAAILHSYVLDWLRRWGYADAILWVVADNARARRFYEKTGWYADGGRKLDETRGFPLTELRYRITVPVMAGR